jgi:hypothetical protein
MAPKAMKSACPEAMAALPDSRVWPPAESSLVSPRILVATKPS